MVTHVKWCVNVSRWKPSREEWLILTSSIARDELDRINKYQFQDDSKSSLIGCAMIRKFLTQITDTPSNQIVLTRNEYGRPEICRKFRAVQGNWPPHIDFNVSHSGDYCVFAGFSSRASEIDLKLGVDVTKVVSKTGSDLARFLDLMKRREFTKSEWETVENVGNDRQKCVNFTRLWCLKESYIKAIGIGLTFKLNRINFRFADLFKYHISIEALKNNLNSDISVLLDGQAADEWRFYLTALDNEHLVALAHKFESNEASELRPDEKFIEIPVSSIVDSLVPIHEADEINWMIFSQRGIKVCR